LTWGAYYLRSGSVYHRGLQAHTLPQGGVYQYVSGMNAGPRATLQHMLPLIWLDPDLGKDVLRSVLRETHPSGEIPYAEVANGALEPVVWAPSDHDLWLLWAVSDYVLATRDHAFLAEVCSYWPPPYTRAEPVWDHLLRALRHLTEVVGYGAHGLLRLRTGDWSDTFIHAFDVPRDEVWRHGESTLNSAMAVHVLRRFAELARFAARPAVEREARAHADRLADAVRRCWRGRHLNRGWLSADVEVGREDLYLEPQPWALIADILEPAQREALVAEIDRRLADPLGSRIWDDGGEKAAQPDFPEFGAIWLSINSTLAWGLSRVDPERAWRELKANTLHNHAETYPESWVGVWAGPDCYLAAGTDMPGDAYATPVYAMQAWPVQILFPHSEPLNATVWLLGITATADGLVVRPTVPATTWSFESKALSIRYDAARIAGSYTAASPASLAIDLTLPDDWHGSVIEVEEQGGERRRIAEAGAIVRVMVLADSGRRADFAINRLPAS